MMAPGQARHVVVTRKRTGIGSDLISVIGAIAYAARTKRDLVIDWRQSRYVKDTSVNMFGELFVAPPAFDDVTVILAGAKFADKSLPKPLLTYTPKQSFQPYHEEMQREPRTARESVIVTRPMHHLPDIAEQQRWLKAILPAPRIAAAIEAFYDSQMRGHPVMGIHIRHGNGEELGQGRDALVRRSVEDLVALAAEAFEKLDLPAETRFLVCTDSQPLRDAFAACMQNVITYDSRLGSAKSGPIHTSEFGLKGAEDAVAEMWLLSRCNWLVYTPSWFSHYARIVGDFRAEPVNLDSVTVYGTEDLHEKQLAERPKPLKRLLQALRLRR